MQDYTTRPQKGKIPWQQDPWWHEATSQLQFQRNPPWCLSESQIHNCKRSLALKTCSHKLFNMKLTILRGQTKVSAENLSKTGQRPDC